MPTGFLTQFAEAAAQTESGGIVGALGIDWQMLIFQFIGFLVLVILMARYVYPVLMKQVDARQDRIEASLAAAREAEDHAGAAQARIDKQLAKARLEAKDIVTTARDEATALLAKADARAKTTAEHLVDNARDEIAREVIIAKKALHNETLELVAQATETVIGKTHSSSVDESIIKRALEEAK